MAARKRESEGRNSDPGRLHARFHAGSVLTPKIQFWEGVISLHKFFTKSVISGSKCPKSKKLEIWNSGDPKILFLEGVIFLYKFFTKSVISGSKHPKSENLELLNFEDPEILVLEGVIFLYEFFTKSMISGSKHSKSENSKICSSLLVLVLGRAQPVLAHACP